MAELIVALDPYLCDESQRARHARAYVNAALAYVGYDGERVFVAAYDNGDTKPIELAKSGAKTLALVSPGDTVLYFGNNALCALGLAPKPAGIMSHAGRIVEKDGIRFVGAMSPSQVIREPQNEEAFLSHVRIAARAATEKTPVLLPKLRIRDLYTAKDIEDMLEDARGTGEMSYDFETTGLDPLTLAVASLAFCTGRDPDGTWRCWFLHARDAELRPLFDELTWTAEILPALEKVFRHARARKKRGFDRIGWNVAFDDWVAEELCGVTLPSSARDAMIEKYCVDTERPHSLKTAYAMYCGYPEYDREVDEAVAATSKRRGKTLVDPSDFAMLEFLGKEPERTKRGLAKWPKGVDKKAGAWATLPRDVLRLYNCLDVVATLELHQTFKDTLERKGLIEVCDLKHAANEILWRSEKRGLRLDAKANREASAYLRKFEAQVKKLLRDEVSRIWDEEGKEYDAVMLEAFNPASNDQVAAILYGQTHLVPAVDRKRALTYFDNDDEIVDRIATSAERYVYGSYKKVKEQLRLGLFDDEQAMEWVADRFIELSDAEGYRVPKVPFTGKLLGVGGLLYDPVTITKTGKPGCGREALMLLYRKRPSEFVSSVLMYRKAQKMRTSFIDKLYASMDHKGLVRTSYRINGTSTGRISSSGNYNAQNWPASIKGQIVARPGFKFFEMDLKGAEVRVLAALSQDERLLEAIYSEDSHRKVASWIFGKPESEITKNERKAGKMTVFLTIYGGGAQKLADAVGVSVKRAKEIIERFRSAFPDAMDWMAGQVKLGSKAPYYVYTAFGTRRSTRNVLSSDSEIRNHTERQCANTPIQGTAGEYMLWLMVQIQRAANRCFGPGEVFVVGTVHDSLLLEAREHLLAKEGEGDDAVVCGELPELVTDTLALPSPSEILNSVRFEVDMDVTDRWGGEFDVKKAIESKIEDAFRWDLITDEDPEEGGEEEERVLFISQEEIDAKIRKHERDKERKRVLAA